MAEDFPYFRRVWKNIVVALLGASFLPLIIIGGGMYYYTASALKTETINSLHAEVLHHKESIDRFLFERKSDLKLISSNLELKDLLRNGSLAAVFKSLQKELPCFVDLGIIDHEGRHLSYVGPYELISKNYKDAPWFKSVMQQGVYISDVFLGYRNVPHFIIAVKQGQAGESWILRATVDTAFFNGVVGDIARRIPGEAYLINEKGIYQTQPQRSGRLMGQSDAKNLTPYEGVMQKETDDRIQVMVWLEHAPWLCVVQTERKIIFAKLNQIRTIGIFAFILGGILIVLTVLLTTNYLIGRLERKRKSIRVLDQQLEHSSRLASAMRLSSGIFQEIKDTLGNIDTIAQWVQDLPQVDLSDEKYRDELKGSLKQIQSQIIDCRKSIDKFLDGTRQTIPMITEINVNEQLDQLLDLLDRELRFSGIKVIRNYQNAPPPLIRSDPSRLRQVFQSLLLNAIEADMQNGKITLTTRLVEDRLYVRITDEGPGIPEKQLETIFDSISPTKPEDEGLRLPICRNILTKLGGNIYARNEPEKGATFVVEIPVQYQSGNSIR